MYRKYIKRPLDIALSGTALLILSPIIFILWIWLSIANKGAGAFFYQERPGKGEKIFRIIKFKTMTDERDADGNLLPDADRLTHAGKFVRSTSLDELPQLWNVFIGDMSLIGPRPLLPRYLGYYTKREKLRHTVRPGITGWAQIKGRNNISWDEKLEYDAWYVEHISLKLDVYICFLTINNVINRKDIIVQPSGDFLDVKRSHKKALIMRDIEIGDLSVRVTWMNDNKINRTLNIQLPVTLESTQVWFERIKNAPNRKDFTFIENDGTIVAMGGLTDIDDKSLDAELYIFVNPNMHGKGYGSESTKLICQYGFEKLCLNKIYLYTNSDNLSAQKVYKNLGFALKKYISDGVQNHGEFRDRYYYELNRSKK